jgi:hypothetical protein
MPPDVCPLVLIFSPTVYMGNHHRSSSNGYLGHSFSNNTRSYCRALLIASTTA